MFVGSCAHKFFAFDRRSGLPRWEYDIHQDGQQTSFHGSPLLFDDLILITTDDTLRRRGIGHVYAFERATGRVRWKHRADAGIPTDVVRLGRNIYVVTLADELLCLDIHTGRRRWSFASSADNSDFKFPAAPAGYQERVFFGGLDGCVYALNVDNGTLAWKRPLAERITTALVIWDDRLYLGASDNHMYCLNPTDGAIVTRLELPAQPRRVPVRADGGLLVFLGDKTLTCLEPRLARVRWSQPTSDEWTSSRPFVLGGLVLVANATGEVSTFSIADGSRRWSRSFAGRIRSIGGTAELLYCGTLQGMLYAWKPGPQQSVERGTGSERG